MSYRMYAEKLARETTYDRHGKICVVCGKHALIWYIVDEKIMRFKHTRKKNGVTNTTYCEKKLP